MNSSGLLLDPCQVAGNATKDGLLVVLACNKRMLAGIVNVTRDYPLEYAKVMFGYIMPVLLLLTLFTNTLVIIVLAQKHMRTPTNIVLFTMAIADLFTLIPPAPWYIYLYTLGHYDKYLYPPDYCYAYHYMTDVIPIYFHTASIWLALLLAGQRYVYVCHPNLAKTWCTVKHVKMAIVLIFVVDFIHQSPKFFDNKFISVYVETDDKKLHLACKNVLAEWAQNKVAIYLPIYYIFRIVFVYVVPCSMLIYINMVLLFTLRKATCRRTQLKSGNYGVAVGADNQLVTTTGSKQKCNSSRTMRETNASFAAGALESQLVAGSPGAGAIVVDCSNNNSETNKSKTTANTTINMSTTPVKEDRFTFSERLAMHFEGTSCESEEELEASQAAAARREKEDHHHHHHNNNTATTMRLSVESNACTCSTSATNSAQHVLACPHQANARRQCRRSAAGSRRHLTDSGSVGQASKDDEDAGSCPECMVCERTDHLECKRCLCVSNNQLYGYPKGARAGSQQPHRNNSSHCSSWLGPTTTNGLDEEAQCSSCHHFGAPDGGLPVDSTAVDGVDSLGDAGKEQLRMAKSRSVDSRMLRKSHQPAGCTRNNSFQARNQQSGKPFEPLPEVSGTQSSSVGDTHQMKRTRVSSSKLGHLDTSDTLLTRDEESSIPVTVKTSPQNLRARVTRLSVVGDLLRSARDNIRSNIFSGSGEAGALARSTTLGAAAAGQLARTIDSNRTTLMLIVVVFVFLFVEVPVAAATIVHVVLNLLKEEHEEVDYTVINNIKLIGNFLIIVSYSINFTIYCSMSKKFRDTFKELFLFKKRPKAAESAACGPATNRHNRPQQHFNYSPAVSKANFQVSSTKSQPATKLNDTTSTVPAAPKKDLV